VVEFFALIASQYRVPAVICTPAASGTDIQPFTFDATEP
jgi:hypothetical protein